MDPTSEPFKILHCDLVCLSADAPVGLRFIFFRSDKSVTTCASAFQLQNAIIFSFSLIIFVPMGLCKQKKKIL